MLVYFKRLWTIRFTDIALMVGGMMLMGFAQLLVVPWPSVRRHFKYMHLFQHEHYRSTNYFTGRKLCSVAIRCSDGGSVCPWLSDL